MKPEPQKGAKGLKRLKTLVPFVFFLCLFVVNAALAGQAPNAASLEGIVTRLGTAEPVVAASVVASLEGGTPATVQTDNAGRFSFRGLQPGRYTLRVVQAGLLGIRPAGVLNISLGPQQRMRDVLLQVIPAALISGRVYDENRRPQSAVRVEALKFRYDRGQRKLVPLRTAAMTSPTGEYSIAGLEPGQYYLRAVPTPQSALDGASFPAVYYPGVTDPQFAAPIRVLPGSHVHPIDLVLTERKTFSVRVRIDNAVVNPFNRFPRFQVIRFGPNAVENLPIRFVSVQGDVYEGHGFAPGSYTIFASLMAEPTTAVEMGRVSVDVFDGNVDAGVLQIKRGVALPGRIVLTDSLIGRVDLKQIRISLQPGNEQVNIVGMGASAVVKEDGKFELPNVQDSQFDIGVSGLPGDVYIQAAMYAGRNVIETVLHSREQGRANWSCLSRRRPDASTVWYETQEMIRWLMRSLCSCRQLLAARIPTPTGWHGAISSAFSHFHMFRRASID